MARSSAGFGADADQDLAYTFSHCLSYFVVEKGVRLDSRMDGEQRQAEDHAVKGKSGEAILLLEPFLNTVMVLRRDSHWSRAACYSTRTSPSSSRSSKKVAVRIVS